MLMWGIAAAVILQILFSQWPVMNTLFETAPLTVQQWLICLGPMLPMLPFAIQINLLETSRKKSS